MLNHIVEVVKPSGGRAAITVWRIPAYRSRGKNSLPKPSPRPKGSMEKNWRSGGGPGAVYTILEHPPQTLVDLAPWVGPVRWQE